MNRCNLGFNLSKTTSVTIVISDEGYIHNGMTEIESLDKIKTFLEKMVERAENEKGFLSMGIHEVFI